MTIHFESGDGLNLFVVDCDNDDCGESAQFTVNNFAEGLDEIHGAGWRSWREYGEWYHECPGCVAKKGGQQ